MNKIIFPLDVDYKIGGGGQIADAINITTNISIFHLSSPLMSKLKYMIYVLQSQRDAEVQEREIAY